MAASADLPVILLSFFWRRFNTAGAVSGLRRVDRLDRPDPRRARGERTETPCFRWRIRGFLSIPAVSCGGLGGDAASRRQVVRDEVCRADGAIQYGVRRGKGDGASVYLPWRSRVTTTGGPIAELQGLPGSV